MRLRLRTVGAAGLAGTLLTLGPLPSPAPAKSRRACSVAPQPSGYGVGGDLFGVTAAGRLTRFSPKKPGRSLAAVGITGLGGGETIVGVDTRPANGQLYAVTSASKLYVVNPASGAAALVGTFATALSGSNFAVDFNPTVDRLRVVSDTGQNLRVNPNPDAMGALAVTADMPINPPGFTVVAAAYTENKAYATATTLYDIDAAGDRLVIQNPPNNGTLSVVGALGVDADPAASFDVDGRYGTAYLTTTSAGRSVLHKVNLATGKATRVGTIVGDAVVGTTVVSRAATTVYAVNADRVLRFDRQKPSKVLASVTLTGVDAGQPVIALDVRPANGSLYGLGANGQLYTVQPVTGAATKVGTPIATAGEPGVGFDFNPVVDRIRVVTASGKNLRVHPDTGAVAFTDPNLNGAAAAAVGAAYLNPVAGTAATTLYDVDSGTDTLYRQDPPNAGTLVRIGELGIDLPAASGFDIAEDNVAFLNSGTSWRCVSLKSGKTVNIGSLPVAPAGIAIAPRGVLR